MRISAIMALMVLASVGASSQSTSRVCVQHLEPSIHYDRLARLARVQGNVTVHLTIGPDGQVRDAVATVVDQKYKAQDILKQRTVELVKKWTFTCAACAIESPYEHDITFTYKLLDEEQEYDGTTVVMELPSRVVVTAYSPVCDHCPPKAK